MERQVSALADEARRLVDVAERDPHRTLEEGAALAHAANTVEDARAESLAHRAAGIAWRAIGDVERSLRELDTAVHCSVLAGDRILEGEARTSRAGSLMRHGDVESALRDLELAITVLTGESLALALMQRATIENMSGDSTRAKSHYEDALRAAEEAGAVKFQAHVHANRGLLLADEGQLTSAEADLRIALELYEQLDLVALAAVVTHNLGLIAGRRGDFVGALTHFGAARRRFATLGHQTLGALVTGECEVLLDVGLADEAARRAARAIPELESAGEVHEVAEACLVEALARLHAGDLSSATTLARRAHTMFRQQSRTGWPEAAELLLLRIEAVARRLDPSHVATARDLSRRLQQTGQILPASHAELLAAQALIATGAPDEALEAVVGLRTDSSHLPVEIALHASAIEVEALASASRSAEANAAVDAAVALLERQHLALGATDVRASVTSHATQLFRVARRMALASNDPVALFDRIEQSRANSLRHQLRAPAADEATNQMLTDLRTVNADIRRNEQLADAAPLEEARARLERELTDHYWEVAGDGAPGRSLATGAGIVEALEGQAMVVLAEIDDQLVAVVAEDTLRVVLLGPIQPVIDGANGLTLSLRRLARRPDADARTSADVATIRLLAGELDDRIVKPLEVDDRPWVLVPPARLHRTAWSLIPTLRVKSLAIAPSATVWLHAQHADDRNSSHDVLVAGPHLEHAGAEIERLAASMPAARILIGKNATASEFLEAVEGARIVHVAAHYIARRGNPMLSSIELEGGDLYLQEIARLSNPPGVMVLSTCDSAAAAVRAGDEVVGIGAALLQLGTRTVIATSNVLPDAQATINFVACVHDALRSGSTPAPALAAARRSTRDDDAISMAVAGAFSCLGRG